MGRNKLVTPAVFTFSCPIPVRITDINYGGHAGNDTILSLIHEARMQYLGSFGYTEMNLAGSALIMSDVCIEFKKELFYGESLMAFVTAGEISRVGFELFYKLEKNTPAGNITVALARTGMVCFDYTLKKITGVPEEARLKMKGF
ncbi:MAG TPA: acyl-CoA thioesterase [Chitinophagaceae bacterium]|nr:acyl-CoA thioesterase [Chitinophagaceae bacterium]HPN59868.1 acyl-CoA thioesterase [Chitinophagaceae bacterium]